MKLQFPGDKVRNKNCSNCRFYYLHMEDYQANIIIERNPDWNLNEFKPGHKLCTKIRQFTHPKFYCNEYLGWYE